MSSVSFIRATELGVPDLFPSNRFRALQEEGRLRTSEGGLIPLQPRTKANVLDWGLITMTRDYKVYSMLTLLAYV